MEGRIKDRIKGLEELNEYTVIKSVELGDINSYGVLLRHKKTGANVVTILNSDKNKTFLIGFRTPVTNSTGVPHIMEHSVLCGSRKYPVKDPFIELAKGSLNTFLNAMTFPDKTIFPIASENDKDFQNLMDVYLDAVFYPKIYEREEIFRQEGWTYELSDRDDELTYNGVVYNEMKGAFSSVDDMIERYSMNSLYPDTGYAYESGGDPDVIPQLSYEEFLDFHRKYYHPSNSYIYLYGDMDMAEKLKYIDKEYLSEFDRIEIDSDIKEQKAFDKVKDIEINYPVAANEPEDENTYLSYNTVVGKITDKKLYVAFQVLEYALVSMPGAPVKQALLDKGIGKDIDGKYNNWILQPYFTITAKNAEKDQKDEFVSTIKDTLKEQVEKGINRESLLAALNTFEFQYREADFGPYPKGLMFSFQVLDNWIYEEDNPFEHLSENEVFEELRNELDTSYFEQLVKEYLIDNKHASVLVAVPKKSMTTEHDEEVKKELAEYKNTKSDEEIDEMVAFTRRLKEYKDTPSPKEDLEKIPLLKVADISKEVKEFHNTEIDVKGTKVVHHDLFTNGIGYISAIFDITDIDKKYLPYLGLMKAVMGYMDTTEHTYTELSNVININTGSVNVGVSVQPMSGNNDDYIIYANVSAKVFVDKAPVALQIFEEIINETLFDDEKRLYEIISELKSKLQMGLMHGGDSAALLRNMSYYSESSLVSEYIRGIEFYKFIEECNRDFDNRKSDIIKNLKEVASYCFRKDNVIISYTCDKEAMEDIKEPLASFVSTLKVKDRDLSGDKPEVKCLNEAFKTSAQIQYVTRAGDYRKSGVTYDGTMRVIRTIMNYEYLWNNVRVKGGAYGCSAGFGKNGDCYFTSYRDPNVKETNDIFENVPEYLETFEADDRDMNKYIIGTISSMDTPLTPMADGTRSMVAYLSGVNIEELKKEREEVLTTTADKIRTFGPVVKNVMEQNNICVLGNEEKIEQNKEMFKNTVELFN